MDRSYDVVVVGGGPAGLAGAVALARARRSVLLVDAGEPRNAPAAHVHNLLAADGTAPGEVLAAGRADVLRYGGEIVDGRVTDASATADGFRLTLAASTNLADRTIKHSDSVVRARRLLVATGLVDELPDVAGLAPRWGRDVLHCPHCHGWEVRDRRIGILATGPRAAQQALLWRQWSPHLVFLGHGGPPPDEEDTQRLAARGIAVVAGPVAQVVVVDDQLTGVQLASGEVVALDAVVVAPRFVARSEVLTWLGLEPVEVELGRQIPADPAGATAVPGVWVAGNVAYLLAQVVTAAATGLNAAVSINADLVAEDTRIAVTAYHPQ